MQDRRLDLLFAYEACGWVIRRVESSARRRERMLWLDISGGWCRCSGQNDGVGRKGDGYDRYSREKKKEAVIILFSVERLRVLLPR